MWSSEKETTILYNRVRWKETVSEKKSVYKPLSSELKPREIWRQHVENQHRYFYLCNI